jgi:hypothetical protein
MPKEWRRLEYLTDRIDDDDGEKWATVSIYRISSINFFGAGLSTSVVYSYYPEAPQLYISVPSIVDSILLPTLPFWERDSHPDLVADGRQTRAEEY